MVSDSDLVARLRQILQSSDFTTTTLLNVRRQLENHFAVDLSDRKRFINHQIDEFLEIHLNALEEEGEDDADKLVHNNRTRNKRLYPHKRALIFGRLGLPTKTQIRPCDAVTNKVIEHVNASPQLIVQGSPMPLPPPIWGCREYWVPIRLSSIQLEQYCSTLIKNYGLLCSTTKRGNLSALHNLLCNLRKCCDHPYVLDPTLSRARHRSPLVDHLSIDNDMPPSGKLQLLSRLLPRIRDQGLRVLIVYKTSSNSGKNCVGVGDILDDFLCQSFGQDSYVHIYNSDLVTKKNTQAAIDLFNDKASGRFIVLTGYKSSLASIRLSSLDVVILFNSDWSPANDIRALQKMTLHTENDHLRVFRLYSVCTLEEEALGLTRDGAPVKAVNQSISRIACNMLLAWGAAYLFEKLDALHASQEANSLESDFLCTVIHELSDILSSNIDDPSISCSVISKASEVGRGYPGNVKLCGEHLEVQSLDDVPPNVFWSSLLDDRSPPHWRFLPEEAGVLKLDTEIDGGWSRGGRSNAKRSKRKRRCGWGEMGQCQSLKEMTVVVSSSRKDDNVSTSECSPLLESELGANLFDPLEIELERIQKAADEALKKHLELSLIHEKTKAHKLLADAWRLAIQDNSPLD